MARNPGPIFGFGLKATSAQLNQLALGDLQDQQLVTSVPAIGGSEVDIIAISDVDVGTGRRIWVTASIMCSNDDGGSHATLRLYQGGTILNRAQYALSPVANQEVACQIEGKADGSAGEFTFRLTVERSHGAGNITVEAGTFSPGLLVVSDRGAQ